MIHRSLASNENMEGNGNNYIGRICMDVEDTV